MNSRLFANADELSAAAAGYVAERIRESMGTFHLALSGGSTPKRLYKLLAETPYGDTLPWNRVHFWFGDERFVPSSDESSNEGMARSAMLSHLNIPEENVHGMYRASSAQEAAAAYEQELRTTLAGHPLDLILLGLGPDAHTASLFPGDPSIHEEQKWVVASTGAAGVKERLTLTPPILLSAKEILFLVSGKEKAEPLRNVLQAPYDPTRYPAQMIARHAPNVSWFLDEDAAGD